MIEGFSRILEMRQIAFPVPIVQRLHRNPERRASKRRTGKDVASGVSRRRQGRNDKTPWGSNHRVLP